MNDQIGASAQQQPPPEAQLMRLIGGSFVTQAIYIGTKLGIADLLANGPKNTADLAANTETHENSLYRLLRALACLGIFAETTEGHFSNTAVSELLRVDSPKSLRAMMLFMGDEAHARVINDMMYSVKTGKPAWDNVHGVACFPYMFETNKPLGDIFNQAMTALSHGEIAAVLDAYDFADIGTLADIAGGHGHFVGSILKKYPAMNGVLFDLGSVIAGAPELLASYGVADRVKLVEGDFFSEIPVVADAYIMKHIIHDWYDDSCEKILGCIHRSMPDDGRVLIVDSVIPPGNDPHPGKMLDLEMLVSPGGKERTANEFETLLNNSGFRMTRIVPTHSPVSIVEAVKA